ncbi:MAG: hypothetical protein KIH10_13675, partial [Candidatus Freyarchaeota archaeon]|nr:hypothetical protein [Candidatus Jordarchaeia archaeon]
GEEPVKLLADKMHSFGSISRILKRDQVETVLRQFVEEGLLEYKTDDNKIQWNWVDIGAKVRKKQIPEIQKIKT